MIHRKQGKDGRFQRQRYKPWTPRTWNDGYEDNRGRFRVYRPDYPNAYFLGYALRAHVVYWLKTGKTHPTGYVLHHKNENRLDDRFINLELMPHGDHTREHKLQRHKFKCLHCRTVFFASGTQVRKRRYEGTVPKFCSRDCFNKFPKSDVTRKRMSRSLRKRWKEKMQ